MGSNLLKRNCRRAVDSDVATGTKVKIRKKDGKYEKGNKVD